MKNEKFANHSFQNDNKIFYHEDNFYPFNFESFIKYSHYFSRKQNELNKLIYINLLDEPESFQNISQESINALISFCKENEINLNISNVVNLNLLAIKYEIPQLVKITNDFISEHYQEIVENFLSDEQNIIQNGNIVYERIISDHLIEIITSFNDQFLSLPIFMLLRIFKRYNNLKQIQNQDDDNDEIIKDFIIRYILKKKKNRNINNIC